jgi:hypothetical protein
MVSRHIIAQSPIRAQQIGEHEELCQSILEDISTIMDLIKAPEPFYSEIPRMAVNLAVNEKAIRAYLQDKRNGQVALNIRTVLSNRENVFGRSWGRRSRPFIALDL